MDPTLSDILWYLALGAFFFMMMRKGGCCGGHRRKEQKPQSPESKVEHKE